MSGTPKSRALLGHNAAFAMAAHGQVKPSRQVLRAQARKGRV